LRELNPELRTQALMARLIKRRIKIRPIQITMEDEVWVKAFFIGVKRKTKY